MFGGSDSPFDGNPVGRVSSGNKDGSGVGPLGSRGGAKKGSKGLLDGSICSTTDVWEVVGLTLDRPGVTVGLAIVG